MHLKLLMLLLVAVLVMVPWAEAGCSHAGCCYCNTRRSAAAEDYWPSSRQRSDPSVERMADGWQKIS